MGAEVVTGLQILSCMGLGTTVLKILRLNGRWNTGTQLSLSFAIGVGILGWFIYILGVIGILNNPVLLSFLIIAATGIFFFHAEPKATKPETSNWLHGVLACCCFLVLFFDFLEGISPPADGDTMAYHFDLAKRFLIDGKIQFVPRAIDGAVPLLVHMTYIPVLGIGGEKALTLWTMASGWAVAALLYNICRQFYSRSWSLAVSLIYLTTPAVVFGGGSGHVEVRTALFVLTASLMIAEVRNSDQFRYTALAGLATGFFVGSKYTGLLFAGACGLTLCGLMLLDNKRWYAHGAVLVGCTLLAGSEWYIWNWIHTGDPVFPIFFELLSNDRYQFWNNRHHELLLQYLATQERGVPVNFWWLFAYPFLATFQGLRVFESSKIGLGPYLILLLPFVLAGIYFYRERIRNSKLTAIAYIAICFYILWFFSGHSQRVRHLVPIYPLALICGSVVAYRFSKALNNIKPLITATIVTLTLQIGGHGVFTVNYARYVFSTESRSQFLTRNVGPYKAVSWVNANLSEKNRIYVTMRHTNYLFDVPIYYAHIIHEALIDIRPTSLNPTQFYHQLINQKITHLLVSDLEPNNIGMGSGQWQNLLRQGCLEEIFSTKYANKGSRVFPQQFEKQITLRVLKISLEHCAINSDVLAG